MAIESHLQTLEAKHQQLENMLAEALASPSTDDLLISSLKRKKLQLKDEIEKLQAQLRPNSGSYAQMR